MSDDKRLEEIIRAAPSLVSDTMPTVKTMKINTKGLWVKTNLELSIDNNSKMKEYAFKRNIKMKQVLDMALTEFFEKHPM